MQSIVDELNMKTTAYWKLSSIWNGRILIEVTTGDALDICKAALESTNYHRPIAKRFDGLLDELIKGVGQKLPMSQVIYLNKVGASA